MYFVTFVKKRAIKLIMKLHTKALGLTTSYLSSLGQELLPNFSGVTSCDTIALIFPDFDVTRSCIINTLEQYFKRGGHWIGLFYNAKTKRLYYWDPYGLPPLNKHILAFLKKAATLKNIKVLYYSQSVQSLLSVFCGFHVLSFLIHKEMDMSSSEFFRLYDQNNLHLNDDISSAFITMYIEEQQKKRTRQQLL